jgi:hypothetical protein
MNTARHQMEFNGGIFSFWDALKSVKYVLVAPVYRARISHSRSGAKAIRDAFIGFQPHLYLPQIEH